MIRLSINWDFISPLLQVMSGTLIIETLNMFNNFKDESTTLIHCKVKKEKGSISYTAIDGIELSPKMWEAFEPQIQSMIHGYFDGMTLKTDQYDWVYDSAHMSLQEWKKKKGIVDDDKDVIYIHRQADGMKTTKTKKRVK